MRKKIQKSLGFHNFLSELEKTPAVKEKVSDAGDHHEPSHSEEIDISYLVAKENK